MADRAINPNPATGEYISVSNSGDKFAIYTHAADGSITGRLFVTLTELAAINEAAEAVE